MHYFVLSVKNPPPPVHLLQSDHWQYLLLLLTVERISLSWFVADTSVTRVWYRSQTHARSLCSQI